jgi:molybdopterin converting factor small subunit
MPGAAKIANPDAPAECAGPAVGRPACLAPPMKITFKLFAMLTDYLPHEARSSNVMALEVPADATVGQVIERFALPPRLVHLVLVNGVYVEPAQRLTRVLQEGDTLAIWPPIAGG